MADLVADSNVGLLFQHVESRVRKGVASLETAYNEYQYARSTSINVKNAIKLRREQIQAVQTEIEALSKQLNASMEEKHGPYRYDGELVIDCCGRYFAIPRALLCRDKRSALAAMCAADAPAGAGSPSQPVILDRDPVSFQFVLSFLEHGSLPGDPDELRALYIESAHYRLTSLRDAIEARVCDMEREREEAMHGPHLYELQAAGGARAATSASAAAGASSTPGQQEPAAPSSPPTAAAADLSRSELSPAKHAQAAVLTAAAGAVARAQAYRRGDPPPGLDRDSSTGGLSDTVQALQRIVALVDLHVPEPAEAAVRHDAYAAMVRAELAAASSRPGYGVLPDVPLGPGWEGEWAGEMAVSGRVGPGHGVSVAVRSQQDEDAAGELSPSRLPPAPPQHHSSSTSTLRASPYHHQAPRGIGVTTQEMLTGTFRERYSSGGSPSRYPGPPHAHAGSQQAAEGSTTATTSSLLEKAAATALPDPFGFSSLSSRGSREGGSGGGGGGSPARSLFSPSSAGQAGGGFMPSSTTSMAYHSTTTAAAAAAATSPARAGGAVTSPLSRTGGLPQLSAHASPSHAYSSSASSPSKGGGGGGTTPQDKYGLTPWQVAARREEERARAFSALTLPLVQAGAGAVPGGQGSSTLLPSTGLWTDSMTHSLSAIRRCAQEVTGSSTARLGGGSERQGQREEDVTAPAPGAQAQAQAGEEAGVLARTGMATVKPELAVAVGGEACEGSPTAPLPSVAPGTAPSPSQGGESGELGLGSPQAGAGEAVRGGSSTRGGGMDGGDPTATLSRVSQSQAYS